MGSTKAARPSVSKPAHQKSYRNVDESGEEVKGFSEYMFEALHHFMMFSSYIPLFLGQFIEDFQIAAAASLGVVVFNALLSFMMYKLGKTQSWPKPLDICFFVLFGIMVIVVFAYPASADFWRFWQGVYFNFASFLFLSVMWCFGMPFTETYVEDEYGKIGVTHPVCQWGIAINCGVWVASFFTLGCLSLPAGIAQQLGKPSTDLLAISTYGTIVVMVSALSFSFMLFPWCMEKYEDKIFHKFMDEILEWNAKHPDEDWAIEFEKAMAEEKAAAQAQLSQNV